MEPRRLPSPHPACIDRLFTLPAIATRDLQVVASKLTYVRGITIKLMQATYNGLELPQDGQPIEYANGQFEVPDHPIIPFIEGDGTGRDIWKASQRVFDAAVEKAYGGKRAIRWFEIFAGEKAFRQFGAWLPDDSVAAARDLRVSIKGPLTTPVGGGIRSLNVALRQILDLYACVRPVKYYQGVPSPVKHPEKLDIVIFRENTEDVYAGIEFKEGSADAARLIEFLNNDLLQDQEKGARGLRRGHQAHLDLRQQAPGALRHPPRAGTGRKTVTLVHKGNIQKFTEGAFREWGYEVAAEEFRAETVTERESWILGNKDANPGLTVEAERRAHRARPGIRLAELPRLGLRRSQGVLDSIGQTPRQRRMEVEGAHQRPHRRLHLPADHPPRPRTTAILATTNLNGDYISDAAAAQVGGLGIAPGANIGDGYAVFEATHGTAPKYADKDVINPGSVILSGVMLLEFIGWKEAAKLIETSLEKTILQKFVTYDFERQTAGATKVGTSEFATRIIGNMTASS